LIGKQDDETKLSVMPRAETVRMPLCWVKTLIAHAVMFHSDVKENIEE
jgi:hypothetical protein